LFVSLVYHCFARCACCRAAFRAVSWHFAAWSAGRGNKYPAFALSLSGLDDVILLYDLRSCICHKSYRVTSFQA